jgi:lipopolysaccharide export system protein LptA
MNSGRSIFLISFLTIFAFLAVCQISFGVSGQSPNANQWQVEAEKETITEDNGSRKFFFEGKVAAHLNEYWINSNRLTLYPGNKRVVAEGNVVFTRKDQKLNCDSVELLIGNGATKIICTLSND